MGRLAAVVIALAACGRLDFVAQPDATPPADVATGHDEDGDGLPDLVDPCPWIAGDATDADGDGVGDACDPHPSTPGDTLVEFSALGAGDATPFAELAGWTREADALRHAGDIATNFSPAVASAQVELGFTIIALVGTGQHQVALAPDTGTDPYYFIELNDFMGNRNAAVVEYQAASGYTTLGAEVHNGVHPGTGLIRLTVIAGDAASFTIDAGWTDEMYHATATTPGYGGAPRLHLVINGLDIELRYVAVVAMP